MSDPKQALQDLHSSLARVLAEAIEQGVPVRDDETGQVTKAPAPAAILNVARQFLKDNGIEAVPAGKKSPLGALAAVMPFQKPDRTGTE